MQCGRCPGKTIDYAKGSKIWFLKDPLLFSNLTTVLDFPLTPLN